MIGVAAISAETAAPAARRPPRKSFYPGPKAVVSRAQR
jgi:hypothetical protein